MEMETALRDAQEKSTGQLHVQQAFTCGGIFLGSISAVSRVVRAHFPEAAGNRA